MADDEKILSIVRLNGPVLPVDIAKGLKTNILIASAYLSELVARKKIKISSVKVGGSPVYYVPGQEAKLDKFAENLNEKELRAYEVLKEKKMLRDEQLTPLMRVALRQISDFAVPLNVTFEGKQELFWKWYLVKDEEITPLIQKELGGVEKKEETKISEAVEEVVKEEPVLQTKRRGRPKKDVLQAEADLKPKQEIKQEQKILKTEIKENLEKTKVETKLKTEIKEEQLKQNIETKIPKTEKEEQKNQEKLKLAAQEPIIENGFIASVQNFFKQKEIRILSEEIIKKSTEVNYLVKIPSPVGELHYLCKAKDKKKSTDKDVSSALVEGQLKRVPVVYLYSGSLNAKAQQMVKTEPFKTMTLFKI